ncbi:MAG: 30S ribosomal protein S20 [bacterium]|nr:30S ribosomal protein S20 [bacterium]
MAVTRRKAGIKALRVTKRRTTYNSRVKQTVKRALAATRKAISAGDAAKSQAALKDLFSKLDRAAKSGVLHTNAVSRYKSRLSVAASKIAKPAAKA